jgi:hypothetical protein
MTGGADHVIIGDVMGSEVGQVCQIPPQLCKPRTFGLPKTALGQYIDKCRVLARDSYRDLGRQVKQLVNSIGPLGAGSVGR